jgi:hypothetical protein
MHTVGFQRMVISPFEYFIVSIAAFKKYPGGLSNEHNANTPALPAYYFILNCSCKFQLPGNKRKMI